MGRKNKKKRAKKKKAAGSEGAKASEEEKSENEKRARGIALYNEAVRFSNGVNRDDEKAAARKAEFEAMMNAADGAGSVSTFFILYLFAHMNFVFYRRWRKRLTRFASSPQRKRKWRMPKTRRSERRSGWRSSR